MSVNSYYFVNRFVCDDYDGSVLLKDEIGYDSTGLVTATYLTADGKQIYREPIGQLDLKRIKMECRDLRAEIDALAQKNIKEMGDTLNQIHKNKLSVRESIQDGLFKTLRETHYLAKKKEAEKQENVQKFGSFLRAIEQRMMHDYYIRQNVFGIEGEEPNSTPWHPVKITQDTGVIRDEEISLEATLARILLINPYSKIPYTSLFDLIDVYITGRRLRMEFINLLLKGFSTLTDGVVVKDYELFADGVLIFRKKGTELHMYKEELFHELCTLPTEDTLRRVIDETFISRVKKYIPPGAEKTLRKYVGFRIIDAIEVESRVYGNTKRKVEIAKEEIDPLEEVDKRLYHSILYLCDPRQDESTINMRRFFSDCSKSWWDVVTGAYPYLAGNDGLPPEELWWREQGTQRSRYHDPAWTKLETVYKYLSGQLEEDSLRITKETALDLLRITKMFDLALAQINCMRAQKERFFRGSYALRNTLLERRPDFSSFDVFSRTLFLKRLINVPYLANPKNWIDKRVGLQARLIANTHVLALSLSERLPSLVGGRGNMGAGKTTALGRHPGTMSTDPIKWGLRKGTGVRNKQVHAEGAMLFDRYFFEELEANAKIYYIMDLRLITPKDISTYLLEPARKRQCLVILKDLDVPLLTTLNRVLKRDPKGEDPVPALDPIVTGFKAIREKRGEVIHSILEEDLVGEYQLHYLGKVVAVKKGKGQLSVLDPQGYNESLRIPASEEIEQILTRVIDEAYILEAIARGDINSDERECLDRWNGSTVRNALNAHANA